MVILILFGSFSSGNHHDMQKWAVGHNATIHSPIVEHAQCHPTLRTHSFYLATIRRLEVKDHSEVYRYCIRKGGFHYGVSRFSTLVCDLFYNLPKSGMIF